MGVFAMPSLGSDMDAGTLVEWLVKPGDHVARGDVVAVVETQKGAIEIETYQEGDVHALTAELGQTLPVGAPMAVILAEGERPPEPPPAPETAAPGSAPAEPDTALAALWTAPPAPAAAPATPGGAAPASKAAAAAAAPAPPPAPRGPGGEPAPECRARAVSPAARVLARERGIDLSGIAGTGPGGAIVYDDVKGATEAGSPAPARAPTPVEGPSRPRAGADMGEMRKAIAAAMSRSKRTIPHFYLSLTCDIAPLAAYIEARNAGVEPSERILLGAAFVRAAVIAAGRVPEVNGYYDEETGFAPAAGVNAGVAVALRGGGLVAPALIGAEGLDLASTMRGMRNLVSRARAGRLRNSEMTQGTITISALGESGAEAMAGVIFPPQVALVGLGAPQTRPWVVDGAVLPRRTVTVTLSVDHRVVDGRGADRFLAAFAAAIQTPEEL